MRNRVAILLVVATLVQACVGPKTRGNTNLSHDLETDLSYQLDSVFVTDKKANTAFSLSPYIFFYFSIKNKGERSVDVAIRRYPFETPQPQRGIAHHGEDIFEFYAAGTTPNRFSIPSGTSKKVTLDIDPLDEIYQSADTIKYEKWVLTSDFIKNLDIHFNWDGEWKSVPIPKDLLITFSTIPDSIAVEWK